jgi:hypothetical protein
VSVAAIVPFTGVSVAPAGPPTMSIDPLITTVRLSRVIGVGIDGGTLRWSVLLQPAATTSARTAVNRAIMFDTTVKDR